MKLFAWIGGLFRGLWLVLFPMFASAGTPSGRAGIIRILRALLLVAILVVLWLLSRAFELERFVRAPFLILRTVWLPLLFVLFYGLCWLGAALWRQLGPERLSDEFPEIDQAWQEARDALAEASIDLTEPPLFLILGRPAGGEKSFFNAAQIRLQVKQVPRNADSPLTISANQDGIFVTFAASLLGRFAELLPAEPDVSGSAPTRPATSADDDAALSVRSRSVLLKDAEDAERCLARLRHFCQLIARDRQPFCPINGLVILIPFAATCDDARTKEAASLCNRDLAAARESLAVNCPIFAVVCDFEHAFGFREFLEFYPEGQRRRLLGQTWPLTPELDAQGRVRMIEKGVQWISEVLFPSLVYKNWKLESIEGGDAIEATARNINLYRFLWDQRARGERLARILTRSVSLQSGATPMLGACGFVATGRDLVREQGFASAFFRMLAENQNHLEWMTDALELDRSYHRWTRLGYIGLGVAIMCLVLITGAFWGMG